MSWYTTTLPQPLTVGGAHRREMGVQRVFANLKLLHPFELSLQWVGWHMQVAHLAAQKGVCLNAQNNLSGSGQPPSCPRRSPTTTPSAIERRIAMFC